ncbi:CRISPR-associated endonuclease Cas1 [Desulforhopalus vacuolatus]|uniref:CRISPR-associated endonuclease Cas1 n=1 Tax=Desulforhopalus vacuolatus TaxID=40414 RepID=UPI001965D340|nr:CRISPR-associated endonuclease Cas1 [Desulforhopalus vacuolatus]MBM9520563.1 CRISPR-associated endonuclease Cas1 [Desulforhopalus vacuolatus]
MRIYVTTQGARITREGRHLLVKSGEDTYRTIFIHKVEQLLLCGNIQITPSARNVLFRNGIDTVFLTRDGRYLGRFSIPEQKNIILRRRQFAFADDEPFCLNFARQIVTGKLANLSTVLMRIYRKKKKKHIVEKVQKIRKLTEQVATAKSVDSLRGYEGRGSALYFSLFNTGFDHDQGFRRRVRRPPTDPVNALLSLLYTFLYNQVYSAVRQAGLDPYIGALHTPDYGRYSLVLDLMEEFRPILVDTLVLALFNMNILKDDDFRIVKEEELEEEVVEDIEVSTGEQENELFDAPVQRIEEVFSMSGEGEAGKLPVQLHSDAMKKTIIQWERKLATTFLYSPEERKIPWSEAMVCQARQYRRFVEGSQSSYQPLLLT